MKQKQRIERLEARQPKKRIPCAVWKDEKGRYRDHLTNEIISSSGGFIVTPKAMTVEEWEKAASEQQAALLRDSVQE